MLWGNKPYEELQGILIKYYKEIEGSNGQKLLGLGKILEIAGVGKVLKVYTGDLGEGYVVLKVNDKYLLAIHGNGYSIFMGLYSTNGKKRELEKGFIYNNVLYLPKKDKGVFKKILKKVKSKGMPKEISISEKELEKYKTNEISLVVLVPKGYGPCYGKL